MSKHLEAKALKRLEEYLVEHLPLVSQLDTFGCELTLLDADTNVALQDPIQEDLWENTQFCLVMHECFLSVESNVQLQKLEYEDCPNAIRVPANDSGILEAKAFFSTARVRHVRVDTGFHTVGRQAWRYCHSLRIVKLPDTVVGIGYSTFQGCYSLQTVEMPGCVEIGVRSFSECCALERVGILTDGTCHPAVGAVIGQYAFEECARLAQLSLCQVRAMVDSVTLATPQAGVPQGCFYASGIRLFLHESRRYVCRFCTSHLDRVKKELLYRLHSNRGTKPQKPHTTTQKETKTRRQPVVQLVWPCRHSEKG